jgi:thioredoxin reductase
MPHITDTVVVVGDGPTGLQCALLLAKGQVGVRVLGQDETPTNKAHLYNYLGADDVAGPAFMEAARPHAERFGAHLHRERAVRVERARDGFRVVTEGGNQFDGRFLVLANGRDKGLAEQLGLQLGSDGVAVDAWGRTSADGVYAGGWLTRGHKIQVAISVGDGAAIALDILSRVRGKPVHDFDVLESPPKAAAVPPSAPSSGKAR